MTSATLSPVRVPSETRTLPNGMRVVAHEDRGAPLVAVHLMFATGSADERPGRTGLAHLLEHLMFEGSQHAPKGAFDDLLERVGASNNGSTWFDRTCYQETVPTNAVELALWLERDRMAHFLPVLGRETLETQRGVVINERRQAYENRPYGLADERLHRLLLPDGHPYAWPTIGWTADLEAIGLDDAREFYARHYVPANAVLVLAGDLAPEAAFRLAERYFGDLPAGEPNPRPPAEVPAAPGGARETMEDDVSFPRVHQAFAVPAYGAREWVALDVLAYLLADGESARLPRALIREGRLAQDVDTWLTPTARCGVFGLAATARSGVEPEALEEALRRVLDGVAERAPSEEEVTGAARRARRDHALSLDTVEERAEALAYAATVLGRAEALEETMALYAEVTAEEVREAAARWLAPERGATLTVVPAEDAGDEEEVGHAA